MRSSFICINRTIWSYLIRVVFTNSRIIKKASFFSKMSINEIHSDIKIDEIINSQILVVFFIHWNQIVIDSIQKIIDRFFLFESSKHDFVCFNKNTHLAFINQRCWLEIINFDLVYSLNEMNNNFRFRMFKHFVLFFIRDH
jgi:hypothetical protein